MISVGTNHISYIEKRNFIDLPYNENISFKKVYDLWSPYNHLLFKLFKKINPNTQYTFLDHPLNNIDIYHLYSSIYYGTKPWVVTSCVALPRWNKYHEKAFIKLAQDNCKKIVFLSNNNLEMQKDILSNYNNDLSREIINKTTVLHPAQNPLISSISNKILKQDRITFTLIGHQILVKGGLETLQVFYKLKKEGFDFRLNLVSKLHLNDYLPLVNNTINLQEVKRLISLLGENINYVESLNQSEINALLINTDVALLPSYGDTYGYSLLEAQAAGCPVISTNTMALPEINNNRKGWVIEVPKIKHNKPDVYSTDKASKFSKVLFEGLYNLIFDIIKNPNQIHAKAENALESINSNHSPQKNASYLENLYLSAIK